MPGKQALNMQAPPLLESGAAFARHAVPRFAAMQHCDTDFGVFVEVSKVKHTVMTTSMCCKPGTIGHTARRAV